MAKASAKSKSPKPAKQKQRAARPAEPEFPLLAYVDDMVDGLRRQVPAAFKQFDDEAIHQARVSTRRLKAAIDLMKPVLPRRSAEPFGRVLRRLRRRLGPLRDLDVMIGHLEDCAKAPRHATAARWLVAHLDARRQVARKAMTRKPAVARTLGRLGAWWGLREEVAEAREAVGSLLSESVHLQLDAFAEQADQIACRNRSAGAASKAAPGPAPDAAAPNGSGDAAPHGERDAGHAAEPWPADLTRIVVPPDDAAGDDDDDDAGAGAGGAADARNEAGSEDASDGGTGAAGDAPAPAQVLVDPHELRIAGKALRYTLEMAVVNGHDLPAGVSKLFKRMQEHLGLWHDFVVLHDTALRASLETMTAHHDVDLQAQVLDLARSTLQRSAKELARFGELWLARGEDLARTIRAAFPLTRSLQAVQEAAAAAASTGEGNEAAAGTAVTGLKTGPGPCDSAAPAGLAALPPDEPSAA